MKPNLLVKRSLPALLVITSAAACHCAEPAATTNSPPGRVSSMTNIVVAADGSGQFKSIVEGINAAATGTGQNPTILRLKPGTYKELAYIQREKRFLHIIGESATNTVITYNLHAGIQGPDGKPIGTFRTPSVLIDADDFTAENVTLENSAGPVGQALAVRIDGDRAVFRNCRFLGWQDTVLANRGRHYFTNCYIEGHVDFIFGGATCFFDHCRIRCLGNGYITAASTPAEQAFGYVFSHCEITATNTDVRTFLGRPWRSYASVAFLDTKMSEVVRPAGWDNWREPAREKTVRYREYNSTGPGANPAERVPWSHQLTETEARALTPKAVLGGSDHWEPN